MLSYYSTVLAKELLFPEDLLINSEDFGDINNLKPEILEMQIALMMMDFMRSYQI